MVNHMVQREVVFSQNDFGDMSAICIPYSPRTTYTEAKVMLESAFNRQVEPNDKFVYVRIFVDDPNKERSEKPWAEEVWALGLDPNGVRQVRRYTMPERLGGTDMWHSVAVDQMSVGLHDAAHSILDKLSNATPMPVDMQQRTRTKEIPEEYGEW